MIGLVQQATSSLLALAIEDDYMANIVGFFVESHTVDLGDILDDLKLLFDEDDPSPVVSSAHSYPHVHFLHD